MNANNSFIKFNCLKVRQPIGDFYMGVINSQELLKIAFADVRRIEDRDIEKYIGLQRPLSDQRVKELENYVTTIDATFPTSVILALNSEDCSYDDKKQEMQILKRDDVAKIIDGQHRLAGLIHYSGDPFELNVTIFIDMDIEDQAMVFATINLKQTKVNKSLVYDLYELAKSRSPQKTCHNIAKLLNSEEKSPLYKKIKILGVATDQEKQSLTQATVVESLLKYISKDPMGDRDLIKRNKGLKKAEGKDLSNLIFRNMFIDKEDEKIVRILWDFFNAVKDKWPNAWVAVRRSNILNRTNGFKALMRFLRDLINAFKNENVEPTVTNFHTALAKIRLEESIFTPDNFKPGTSGESELYKKLRNEYFENTTTPSSALATVNNKDLRQANLSRQDLHNRSFEDACLVGANLSRANLSGSSFRGADLSNANLSHADLKNANLSNTFFTCADLRGADLSDANLNNADLSEANLEGTILLGANLEGAYLVKASLRNANLEKVELANCDLTRADVDKANFTQANDILKAQITKAINWKNAVYSDSFKKELFPKS
ncbi:MAG: DGQHR domain-containing protein [Candidatus Auribacterota bacterium]